MKITTDLSSVQIWDDLIDDKFLLDLDEESNFWDWHLSNVANRKSFPYGNKGSHLFWSIIFDPPKKAPIETLDLYSYMSKNYLQDKFDLKMVQLNGQSLGQNGTAHLDIVDYEKDNYTLMLFLNYKWKKEWGGEFQFLSSTNNNFQILKSLPFIPGRMIFFKGNIPHRGLAPTEPYIIRKTLVYRLVKNG